MTYISINTLIESDTAAIFIKKKVEQYILYFQVKFCLKNASPTPYNNRAQL